MKQDPFAPLNSSSTDGASSTNGCQQTTFSAGDGSDFPPPYTLNPATVPSSSSPAPPNRDTTSHSTGFLGAGEQDDVPAQKKPSQPYQPSPAPSAATRNCERSGPYKPIPAMSMDHDDLWSKYEGQPGCCFSDTGGCCFSTRGGCCFSDTEGCCFSQNRACCFSNNEACCFSDHGGGFGSGHRY